VRGDVLECVVVLAGCAGKSMMMMGFSSSFDWVVDCLLPLCLVSRKYANKPLYHVGWSRVARFEAISHKGQTAGGRSELSIEASFVS
jgi:hypothetical protein